MDEAKVDVVEEVWEVEVKVEAVEEGWEVEVVKAVEEGWEVKTSDRLMVNRQRV